MSTRPRHSGSFRSGQTGSRSTYRPPQQQRRGGLAIRGSRGQQHMLFTDQQMADDLLAAVPKLHAAISDASMWRRKGRRAGVTTYEPARGSDDVAYASLAKTEIKCHLNEVLNVLISHESSDYQSTMSALCGDKFRDGRVIFQQRCHFSEGSRQTLSSSNTEGQKVLISVNMAKLQPTLHMKLQSKKYRQPQKLCFAAFTHQYDSKNRAVHVLKTLPKHVHDELVPRSERTALRQLDHLAVGFDIQSTPQITQIVAHGYASLMPQMAKVVNPQAKHVINLLTRSLREFERVIRRRRFGFQSFVYFHTASLDDNELKWCSTCQKRFSLLRRDFFCQLCGHLVCKDCSQLYEVEARVGDVRKNRICVECVVRVDACKFEDENLIAALGPTVVSDGPWFSDSEGGTASLESYPDALCDQLASSDATMRSQALEQLGRLISPSRHKHRPTTKNLARKVEHHLNKSLRVAEKAFRPEDCDVADLERDYAFEFDGKRTRDPNHPLPPMPEKDKEKKRLRYIHDSGVLDPKYDRAALNLLAQVAAKQLNCPIGYVSVVGEDMFHAVGTFPLRPPEMNVAPRVENMCAHTVYADKPLVVKNPQRDMRFAQMPIIKDAGVKFYAGFPIRAPDGAIVASLCTSDFKPHDYITTKEYATMETLAKLAGELVAPRSPPAY